MNEKEINNLVEEYRGYIHRIAGTYTKDKSLLEDLTQECYIALIKAARNFNKKRGIKFKTYVFQWLKGYIMHYLRGKVNIIRVPEHFYRYIREYEIVKSKLSNKLGREPTEEEIKNNSEILKDSHIEKISNLKDLIPLSLDYIYDDEDRDNFVDTISELKVNDSQIDINLISTELQKSICKLSPRQAEVIRLHFGFNKDKTQYNYTEISKLFDCSSENIRQIEKKALKNLRKIIEN